MPTYVVESYAAGSIVEDQRIRAQRAAQVGRDVRYIRTTFPPDDETLLHLFEATSRDELLQAAIGAELDFDRIVDAIESRPGSGRSGRPDQPERLQHEQQPLRSRDAEVRSPRAAT